MKQKYLTLLLAAGMAFTTLTGCSTNTGNDTSQKTTTVAEKETKAAQVQTQATEAQTAAPQTQATEAQTAAPQTQATEAQTATPQTQATEAQTATPQTQATEAQTAAPQTQATEEQTTASQTEATEAQTQATEVPVIETDTDASGNTAASQAKRVEPLAPAVSMDNLTDCTVAASFTNSDISENGDGALVIHMTVYDYELFDAVDISGLQAGDVLDIAGQDVTVSSVENADGRVDINGGVDGGGVSLLAGDGGTYFETLGSAADAVYNYQALGDVTLPVSQDFVYDDQANLEQGEQTYYAGDLLTMSDSADFGCDARNGKVQIVGGEIVGVTRIYTP